MKTATDLTVGVVGYATAEALNGYTGLITALGASVYLICKGIVLVIREYRRRHPLHATRSLRKPPVLPIITE